MSMFGFPLLLIPLAVVNIIAFLMPGVSIDAPLYTVPLPSGVSWTITFADALLAFSMLLMFFEAAKTVRPNGKYLTDHLLSFLVFGGAAAEFVMLPRPQFSNSTFFLLTVLAFIDFITGVTLRVRLRRLVGARSRAPAAEPQRAEPTLAPAPASAATPDARQDPVLELNHPIEPRPPAPDPVVPDVPKPSDEHREEQRS